MPLKIPSEQRKKAVESIARYFSDELEHEIGELQAGFVLDYFLTEIAPLAYNQGVADARRFLEEKIEDLSGSCFEHELTFWDQPRKAGKPDRE